MNKLIEDTNHWQNLEPPLCPNPNEVELYESIVKDKGPVCLLGMTKQLIHICDYMVDLNPIPQPKPVIKSDWYSFECLAEAIIGDGILNLAGMEVVPKLLDKCDLLVCRVFLKKMCGMKYATHFPTSFPGASRVIPTQADIAIVVWDN
jgi:hypothetical protein